MGLRLNKISDAVIRENLLQSIALLQSLQETAAPEAGRQRERHLVSIADLNFEIGTMTYQQEGSPAEVRAALAKAGQYFLEGIHGRQPPNATDSRNPYEFEKAISLVVCFCDTSFRKSLGSFREDKYRYPPHLETQLFGEYLVELIKFLSRGTLDAEVLASVIKRAKADSASRDDHVFTLAKARGLQALQAGNVSEWERAVVELVDAHRDEALKGEYKLLADGFIALPALMLARLGMERGYTCRVNSPYLPFGLLVDIPA
ncbi:Imm49 family immunity protein [Microvirga pakistanensis]|uniref:Imm49 family immunity protein n=1 Tax=Microvirga pakistanensis TaxID=1682650 RepID=UPI00106B287F|nr:Imm49 family immunity protein [Microvirga pakistanensis]